MRLHHRQRRLTERDLAALADGSITAVRRDLVEQAVAGSPELQARLLEQRRAQAVVRSVRGEPTPAGLRASVAAVRVPSRRVRLGAVAPAAAGALGALVLALVLFAGSSHGPTVAEAAALAKRPPMAPVYEPPAGRSTLPSLRTEDLPFPYWDDHFGWRAVGFRNDTLAGTHLTTVFYRRANDQIGYTIVSGARLPAGVDAPVTVRNGIVLRVLVLRGQRVVTWLRRGHTCVLSGSSVGIDTLLQLASWRGNGELPY